MCIDYNSSSSSSSSLLSVRSECPGLHVFACHVLICSSNDQYSAFLMFLLAGCVYRRDASLPTTRWEESLAVECERHNPRFVDKWHRLASFRCCCSRFGNTFVGDLWESHYCMSKISRVAWCFPTSDRSRLIKLPYSSRTHLSPRLPACLPTYLHGLAQLWAIRRRRP